MTGDGASSAEKRKERLKREADKELNQELEQTFPASDPPTITRTPYEREFALPRQRRRKPD